MAKEKLREDAAAELAEEEEVRGKDGLTSLKRTPAEKKELEKKMKDGIACGPGSDEYPWGLSITLEKDTLDKLGVKNMPKVGAALKIVANAEVIGVSVNAGKESETREIRLQLTDMKVN